MALASSVEQDRLSGLMCYDSLYQHLNNCDDAEGAYGSVDMFGFGRFG
jgi:hypothetical protein